MTKLTDDLITDLEARARLYKPDRDSLERTLARAGRLRRRRRITTVAGVGAVVTLVLLLAQTRLVGGGSSSGDAGVPGSTGATVGTAPSGPLAARERQSSVSVDDEVFIWGGA